MSESNPEPQAREAATPSTSEERPQGSPPESSAQPSDAPKKRRRGSRGGRNRNKNRTAGAPGTTVTGDDRRPDDLPERASEGRPSAEAAERSLVRRPGAPAGTLPTEGSTGDAPGSRGENKPRIGDSRPAIGDRRPAPVAGGDPASADGDGAKKRRRRGGRGRSRGGSGGAGGGASTKPVEHVIGEAVELDEETLERRRGRERK